MIKELIAFHSALEDNCALSLKFKMNLAGYLEKRCGAAAVRTHSWRHFRQSLL